MSNFFSTRDYNIIPPQLNPLEDNTTISNQRLLTIKLLDSKQDVLSNKDVIVLITNLDSNEENSLLLYSGSDSQIQFYLESGSWDLTFLIENNNNLIGEYYYNTQLDVSFDDLNSTIELRPVGKLLGKVKDKNNVVISNAYLNINCENNEDIVYGVLTDSKGDFIINYLPEGLCNLLVNHNGIERESTIIIKQGEELNIDIILSRDYQSIFFYILLSLLSFVVLVIILYFIFRKFSDIKEEPREIGKSKEIIAFLLLGTLFLLSVHPVESTIIGTYTQSIEFPDNETATLIYSQHNIYAPEAGPFIYLDEDLVFYRYVLDFNEIIDPIDLEDASIEILGQDYNIKEVSEESITLVNGLTEITLSQYEEVIINEDEVDATQGIIYSEDGDITKIVVDVGVDYDQYIGPGKYFYDPVFGNFKIMFDEIEIDDYETIEFTSQDDEGEIFFYDNEDRKIRIYLTSAQDSEDIYYGEGGDLNLEAYPDHLFYLDDETCDGNGNLRDCVDARFLLINNSELHVFQITNIDTKENTIDFEDLTFKEEYNDYEYDNGGKTYMYFGDIETKFIIDESDGTIKFDMIGSKDQTEFNLEYGTFKIVNDEDYDGDEEQIFEALAFNEYNDEVLGRYGYLTDVLITAEFDDNNGFISYDIDDFDYSKGWGDINADDDGDIQQYVSYKGTVITLNPEDDSYVTIEHPEEIVYADVCLLEYNGDEEYYLGNDSFYYSKSIYEIDNELTSDNLPILLKESYVEKQDYTCSGDSCYYGTIDEMSNGIIEQEEIKLNLEISLNYGWNLISLPGQPNMFSSLTRPNKEPLAYIWSDAYDEYLTIQEAEDLYGDDFDELLESTSFWIYAFEEDNLWVKFDQTELFELELNQGTNYVPFNIRFVGYSLDNLNDNCIFTRISRWNSLNQEWNDYESSWVISNDDLGSGLVVEVEEGCSLLA